MGALEQCLTYDIYFPIHIIIIIIISVTTAAAEAAAAATKTTTTFLSTEIVIFHEFAANVPYICVCHSHLLAPHPYTHVLLVKLSSLKNNTKLNCFPSLSLSLSLSFHLPDYLFSFIHKFIHILILCFSGLFFRFVIRKKQILWICELCYKCGLYAAALL